MKPAPEPESPSALRVVGYVRVSTMEQAESGAGLEAQTAAVLAEVARRGWHLVALEVDAGASGSSLNKRPALASALDRLASSGADALVVAKLDRLSRSVVDFASVLECARRQSWGLIALDLGVDTTTPAGELVANVMAAVAQWERRVISQRTIDGLAARRRAGQRLGRPGTLPDDSVNRILKLRAEGYSLRAIATVMESEGHATAHGGEMWRASSVSAVLKGQRATELHAMEAEAVPSAATTAQELA